MGTRNLTIVVHDEQFKVAKYCQWDGYPEGQGVTILDYLLNDFDQDKLLNGIEGIYQPSEEDILALYEDLGADVERLREHGLVDYMIGSKFNNRYPSLGRDLGGEILRFLQVNGENHVLTPMNEPNVEFAADSLFCEWAYVIDLDEGRFEVYEGFNTEPLKEHERFYFLQGKNQLATVSGSVYYPVKLVRQYSLNDLPSVEQFLETFKEDE